MSMHSVRTLNQACSDCKHGLYLLSTHVLLLFCKTLLLNEFMIRKKGKRYMLHVKMLVIISLPSFYSYLHLYFYRDSPILALNRAGSSGLYCLVAEPDKVLVGELNEYL